MRLFLISMSAMVASTACLGLLFLYALIVPTLPPPAIAISAISPSPSWRGEPVENWDVQAAPALPRPITLASDGI